MMKKRYLLLGVATGNLVAGAAMAHPGHEASGFVHGLEHPLGGLDHVLAMVAVGLLAAQMKGRALWALPLAFVGAMALAGIAGAADLGLPLVELGISASIVVLGLVIALGRRLPLPAALVMVAGFAVFHGYAHGAELPGDASGLGYGIGFMLATAALHVGGIALGLGASQLGARYGAGVQRVVGSVIAAMGAVLLAV